MRDASWKMRSAVGLSSMAVSLLGGGEAGTVPALPPVYHELGGDRHRLWAGHVRSPDEGHGLIGEERDGDVVAVLRLDLNVLHRKGAILRMGVGMGAGRVHGDILDMVDDMLRGHGVFLMVSGGEGVEGRGTVPLPVPVLVSHRC